MCLIGLYGVSNNENILTSPVENDKSAIRSADAMRSTDVVRSANAIRQCDNCFQEIGREMILIKILQTYDENY